ncbi:MAG: ribose-phosphate diphosphokinase [Myxococcota bacterium]
MTLLFSIREHEALAAELRELTGYDEGQLECRIFPDGERYLRILSPVRAQDVVIVGGTTTDTATLDIFDLACGLVTAGCQSLTLLIPFFGYSTMERAVKSGEVVTAKTRAHLLSIIPTAPGGNRVALLDLHSEGIPHYFEPGVVSTHLYAKSVILDAIRGLGLGDFSLGSVDAGRAKWVESLANDLGVVPSFVLKRRSSDRKTEVIAVSASVSGRPVVIYDDMIRTGGSLLGAARAFRDAGATDVYAVASHGVFPGDALERIRGSGFIRRVVVTNSHPWAMRRPADDGFLTVRSCAPVFQAFLATLGHA